MHRTNFIKLVILLFWMIVSNISGYASEPMSKSEDSTIFPTLKSGDPNERPYTNKDGSGSSHNDIGGGIGSKPNPAHSAMVNWAKNSGVKINNKNL